MLEFERVAVLGAGVIGASWTALFLARGLRVDVYDPAADAQERVRDYVARAWPALQQLGPAAWLVNGALCAALLVSVVPLIILANLPSDLRLEPVGEHEVHAELQAMRQRLLQLGFQQAGPPLKVHIAPAAMLAELRHVLVGSAAR